MTAESNTLQSALVTLGINNDSGSNTITYQNAGQMPQSLLKHTVKKDYVLVGVTPEEFIKKHGSTTMDFEDVQQKFKSICKDYLEPLQMSTPSKAVEFCSKMIYEVGPEARQVRRKDGDKTWRFLFMYKKGDVLVTKVAFVSTYKMDDANYNIDVINNKITLSVKTASLLAIPILHQLNKLSINMVPQVYLLTPLAGSIFSKDDVDKIALEAATNPEQVLACINSSCQSGGHYLHESRMHIAAVANIVATRNVKDSKMRDGIIGKTLKQYLNMKKQWSVPLFELYSKYGHGGVPSNISPQNLIQMFESVQKVSPLTAVIASKTTTIKSKVTVPDPTYAISRSGSTRSRPATP